jgi:catechol 2,3-dioxygenase-like lactoylglutathione lyase family enzyme
VKFDHAIIAVTDLDAARAEYEALGFTVISGGVHASRLTHNALVVFSDGAYLELLAPTEPRLLDEPPEPGPGNYLFMLDAGEGCSGYAFVTDDVDGEVSRLRAAGLEIGDPESGGRLRADGVELRWRTAMFEERTVPFFITDETRRSDRVPGDPPGTTHSNRATGVAGVLTIVRDLEAEAERYAALLGADPKFGTRSGDLPSRSGGTRTAEFDAGEFRVRLAEATDGTSGYLARRGEFPYEIYLHTVDPAHAGTHEVRGVRIVLQG